MPVDSKKNNDKKKHDPKEQRKPRQSRNQGGKSNKISETVDEIKATPKVSVPQKPVYVDPGPEFYKNLKRETEEIVKITETENAKYKKKEIQSNWAKYEMPIESYEDLDEQDIGADYEKLIQAPLSAGGHFQFKHEKSWDTCTAPSLYDKYFDFKYENLSTAISSIPFYERNNIDESEFSETDLLSMNNRASKYKLKYFNDKTFSTPEVGQDRIIKENLSLISDLSEDKDSNETTDKIIPIEDTSTGILEERSDDKYEVNFDLNATKIVNVGTVNCEATVKQIDKNRTNDAMDDFDDEFLFKDVSKYKSKKPEAQPVDIVTEGKEAANTESTKSNIVLPEDISNDKDDKNLINNVTPKEHPVFLKPNPVIESPEDLEKWLDDFLDS